VEGRSAGAENSSERCDEARSEEKDVEAERASVKEAVTDDSEHDSDEKERCASPALERHGRRS
jgi:hypothetical protein